MTQSVTHGRRSAILFGAVIVMLLPGLAVALDFKEGLATIGLTLYGESKPHDSAKAPDDNTVLDWGYWFEGVSDVTDASLKGFEKRKELRVINLHGAFVSDEGLRHLEPLTNLQSLDLSSTTVSDEGMKYLKGMTRLRSLSLDDTYVTTLGPLTKLSALESLSLVDSEVSDAGLQAVKEMKSLKSLDLSLTRATDAGLAYVSKSASLESLALARGQITPSGLQSLMRMPTLRFLRIDHTSIGDTGAAVLGKMKHLQGLNLRDSKITDAGIGHLTGLADLRALSLASTKVGDPGVASLKGFKNLEWIDLANTPITDGGVAELKGLTNLTVLDLSDTAVTDAGIMHLQNLKELRYLQLVRTKVSATGALKLRQALPKCKIINSTGHVLGRDNNPPGPARIPDDRAAIAQLEKVGARIAKEQHGAIVDTVRPLRRCARAPSRSAAAPVCPTASSAEIEHVLKQLRLRLPNKTDDEIIQVLRDVVPDNEPAKSDGARWFAERLQQVKAQREALEEIGDMQGGVFYDFQLSADGTWLSSAEPRGPAWLRNLLGTDFFARVVRVCFVGDKLTDSGLSRLERLTALEGLYLDGTRVTDAGLQHIRGLTQLRELGLNFTAVSDGGLEQITGLVRLRNLELVGTQVSAAGVAKLQRALPNCKIEWEPPTLDERQRRAAPDQPGG